MKRRVILIFGKAGTGKSTLAQKLSKREKRIIILDPLFEFNGDVICSDFDSFGAYVYDHLHDERFRIVCRFSDDVDNEYFFRLARELKDYTLAIDEAEIFLDPRSTDENFSWIVSYGRHSQISVIAVGRRVPEISVKLRAQATSVITFSQTEPRDLKNLEEYGFDINQIKTLRPYTFEYVGENPDTATIDVERQEGDETISSGVTVRL